MNLLDTGKSGKRRCHLTLQRILGNLHVRLLLLSLFLFVELQSEKTLVASFISWIDEKTCASWLA